MFPSRCMPPFASVEDGAQASNNPEADEGRDDSKARGDSPFGAKIDTATAVLVQVTVSPRLLRESTAIVRQS
jgi:hypothetical protein